MKFTIEELDMVFNLAENETADMFMSQTCIMKDKHGDETCPICYFRSQVKKHLTAIHGHTTIASREEGIK